MADQDVPMQAQTPSDAPDPSAAPDLQPDAAAPTPQEAGIQPAAMPSVQGAPQMPAQAPAPAAPGNKWANIVKGALSGLALGGAPGFVAGAIAPTATRQAFKNNLDEGTAKAQQAAANVRFTDAQAASMQSETAMRQIQAEHLPQTYQMAIQKNDLETVKFLTDHGASPVFTTDGADPASLQAALKSVSDNNGSVPSIVTFHVGDKLVGYDLSRLGQNSGALQQLNQVRAVQGQPLIDNATFYSKALSPAARSKMIASSLQFYNPVPEVDPDKLKTQTSQYANYLQHAKDMPEDSPNRADSVEKLTAALDLLKNAPAANGVTEKEKSQIRVGTTVAAARASANNMSKGVEVAGDNGSTRFQTMGDAIKSGAVGSSTVKALAPLEKTAEAAETSYAMFQDAYDDFKKGVPTGAQSMLALSQHLATTFGTVKGSRITKDMISEHLGARSISDGAEVALNKFVNGDVLSPDQWNAFKGLISQSRKYAWATYSTTAKNKGVNVRGMVPKDLGGQNDIRNPGTAGQPDTNPPGKAGGVSVTDPAGGVHTFPDQASADKFKKLARIQ